MYGRRARDVKKIPWYLSSQVPVSSRDAWPLTANGYLVKAAVEHAAPHALLRMGKKGRYGCRGTLPSRLVANMGPFEKRPLLIVFSPSPH